LELDRSTLISFESSQAEEPCRRQLRISASNCTCNRASNFTSRRKRRELDFTPWVVHVKTHGGVIDYGNLGTHRVHLRRCMIGAACVGKRHAREHAREDTPSIMALMQAATRDSRLATEVACRSHAIRRMTTENKPRNGLLTCLEFKSYRRRIETTILLPGRSFPSHASDRETATIHRAIIV